MQIKKTTETSDIIMSEIETLITFGLLVTSNSKITIRNIKIDIVEMACHSRLEMNAWRKAKSVSSLVTQTSDLTVSSYLADVQCASYRDIPLGTT